MALNIKNVSFIIFTYLLSYLHIQETGRPLLLMVDEKKIHALPINALNIEAAASSNVQSLQCYSVQIPVVAYHNVPLQISNIPRQTQEGIKIECQSDSMKNREFVGNICDPVSTLANSTYDSKESENEKCLFNGNKLFAIIYIVYIHKMNVYTRRVSKLKKKIFIYDVLI